MMEYVRFYGSSTVHRFEVNDVEGSAVRKTLCGQVVKDINTELTDKEGFSICERCKDK